MNDVYATPFDIKQELGDGISQTVEKYDAAYRKMIATISRLIDNITGRQFFPVRETRYYNGSGFIRQWIDDLLEIENAYYSDDNGQSYIEYNWSGTPADFYLTRAGNYNSPAAYNYLVGNLQSSRNYFPQGQRSVKITGTWAYHESRAGAWLASGTTSGLISGNGAQGDSILITVGDATLYQIGQILKVDNEMFLVTMVNTSQNKIAATRAYNGTQVEMHMSSTSIYVWQVPALAAQACIMQAVRTINRAMQGFADGRATPELGGQVLWVKRLDPEVETMLTSLVEHL